LDELARFYEIFRNFLRKFDVSPYCIKAKFFSKKFFYPRTPLRDFVALSCYEKNNANFVVFGTEFAVLF